MQARSLDPVAHPRAIQPLDQNTEVRLKDNYYVVSHRDKSVKMCDNLLLFLFIWDISGHVSKSYYFQRVRATRNIMHVTLSLERGIDHDVRMGDRLALMSIHAAKGLEWPMVFFIGCEDAKAT